MRASHVRQYVLCAAMQWSSDAQTALEAPTFAHHVSFCPTSIHHFIGWPAGLVNILLLCHYTHQALYYSLGIMASHVHALWRYVCTHHCYNILISYNMQGFLATQELEPARNELLPLQAQPKYSLSPIVDVGTSTRHTHSTSIKPAAPHDSRSKGSRRIRSISVNSVKNEPLPPLAQPKWSPSPMLDVGMSAGQFEPLMDHFTKSLHRVHTAKSGNLLITIVHQSGIFAMEILYCACINAADYDEQLMNAGLFPSTYEQI